MIFDTYFTYAHISNEGQGDQRSWTSSALGLEPCSASRLLQLLRSRSLQLAQHTPSMDQGQHLLQFSIKYIGTVFLCISRINGYHTCHCGLVHSYIMAASHNCLCLSIWKSGTLDFWFHFFFLCNKPGILTCIMAAKESLHIATLTLTSSLALLHASFSTPNDNIATSPSSLSAAVAPFLSPSPPSSLTSDLSLTSRPSSSSLSYSSLSNTIAMPTASSISMLLCSMSGSAIILSSTP